MLNPKELMLGNYVYESERTKFPMKVVNIDEKMVYLDFEGNEGDVFDGDEKDICPIPLTKEILLKNGFKEYVYGDFAIGDFDLQVSYSPSEGFYLASESSDYNVFPIKYVHQLQNILTIAGIDIDFKI